MSKMSSSARFFVVVLLLAGTSLFLFARRQPEVTVPYRGLAQLPLQLGAWSGFEETIPQETLDILGRGEFLQRLYRNQSAGSAVDLFVAYFPSQRVGVTIHSPKNCLPGSGWAPIQSARIALLIGGETIVANRYIVAKGDSRDLVLYWYQAHGRSVASEYWAKYYLVKDAITMNRSDGSLVRIVTSLPRGEDIEVAQNRAAAFARALVPPLAEVIPQ